MARKELDVHGTSEQAFSLAEIGMNQPIEKVSETNFVKEADLEQFMNEVLTIIVAASNREGDLEYVVPSVNGMNQPIVRGVQSKVKRKYVERLVYARPVTWSQNPRLVNGGPPPMVARTTIANPFTVIHDPNPKGRAWLESLMAQPQSR